MGADICDSCGTKTVRSARFCHNCGARLDVAAIDVDLFGPTEVHVEATAPPTSDRRRLVAVLTIVAVAGIVAISTLTGSDDAPTADPAEDAAEDPVDLPPTTTSATEEPAEVTTTEPTPEIVGGLQWTRGPELGSTYPLAFVEHDDGIFFFSAGEANAFGGPGDGLHAWRSDDGVTWEALGAVLEAPARVSSVASGPDALLAVGTNADRNSVLWSSADGIAWTEEQLPIPADSAAGIAVPRVVVAAGDTVVILGVGGRASIAQRVVEEAIGDVYPLGYAWAWGTPAGAVSVMGPFGLVIGTIPVEGLDYTAEELAAIEDAWEGRSAETIIWSRTGSDPWRSTTLDDIGVNGLVAQPDNTFLMTGWPTEATDSRAMSRSSDDGITWTDVPDIGVRAFVRWGDAVVGRATDDELSLRVSRDGDHWQTISLSDVVPDEANRHLTSFAAGNGGIAVQVTSFDFAEMTRSTPSIIKDGLILTVPADSGGLVLHDGVTERLRIPANDGSAQDRYTANIERGTVTFLDPDTGGALVTFTFDELRLLERQVESRSDPAREFIAVSPDAISWSITWLSDLTDEPGASVMVGVTKERVIASISTRPSSADWLAEPPTVQIFTAEIPAP